MRTFVLVHGAWHGAWCWSEVTRILESAGHRVHVPTLAGLGERAHLLSRAIGLDTHVDDVVEVLVGGDLSGVVLVGHSYGGMLIAGAVDRVPDRVARLVFLDAFVADDGQSVLDLMAPERRDVHRNNARDRGDGWLLPPPPAEHFGLAGETASRADAQLTPQPLRTFEDPLQISGADRNMSRAYIHCTTGPLAPSFAPLAQRCWQTPGWTSHELATGHDAMLTAPEELCELLLRTPGPS